MTGTNQTSTKSVVVTVGVTAPSSLLSPTWRAYDSNRNRSSSRRRSRSRSSSSSSSSSFVSCMAEGLAKQGFRYIVCEFLQRASSR